MTAEIQLTKGYVSIVDDVDADLAAFNWQTNHKRGRNSIYAQRKGRCGEPVTVQLHRVILARKLGRPLDEGELCDHISGDGLDNRRANLRPVTAAQNNLNKSVRRDSASRVKGVGWHKHMKRWFAHIQMDGKRRVVGYFRSVEEASAARTKAEAELHGEYARLAKREGVSIG